MKRLLKTGILTILSLLMLFAGISSVYAQDANDPVNLARRCTYEDSKKRKSMTERLGDRDESTRYTIEANGWVSVRWKNEDVDFVYYEWTDKIGVDPAPYTLELLDAEGGVVETREGEPYWNNGVEIPEGVYGVRLTLLAEADLCTLIPYRGGAPKDYHPWNPTLEKADFLVIAMHPDDDCLFMGNVIATYGTERGYHGTILYLATRTRIRRTEALNGAWIMGQRTYPLMAGLPDIPIKYREEKNRDFLPEDVERVLVRYLRRLKPEVVVTHDDNGEYGHWQHMIVAQAIRMAVTDAADPAYDPESVKEFGEWQVKKLYLHLAAERPIFVSATTPLDSFGGRTGLEVAAEAYQCHQSQRLWNHLCDNQNECSLEKFGLVFTTVGNDTGINDLFEHVDLNALPQPTEEPTPEPTPEPTEPPEEQPTQQTPVSTPAEKTVSVIYETTEEPTEAPEMTPAPDPEPNNRRILGAHEDRRFWIILASALMLTSIAIAAAVVTGNRVKHPDQPLHASKPTVLLLVLASALFIGGAALFAGLFVQKCNAGNGEPNETDATGAATPAPISMLTIRTADDAKQLELFDTIRAVEIVDGALENDQIEALTEAYPQISFSYRIRVGDRFVSPNETSLERLQGESIEAFAQAVPYLKNLKTLRLGVCTPEELTTAYSQLGSLRLIYSVSLYGIDVPQYVDRLDLSEADVGTGEELLMAIPYLNNLKTVDLGDNADPDTVIALLHADTGLTFRYAYTFTYLDKTLTESTDVLDLSGEQITDLDELRTVIARLPKLERVEMLDCGIDDATMAALRDEYPDIKVVWEIDLGFWGKLRTDAIAFTTRSSKRPDEMKYRLTTEKIQPLQYCTDLVALDLGHQQIEDISCLKTLTKLQILILADNKISDLTALASMPDLVYVELFINRISDLSPLSGLKNIKDLNICTNRISDLTPLYPLTTLERLWYSNNKYTLKDHTALQERLPNCICNRTVWQETDDGWREHERYFWMRSFFENSPRYITK